MFCIYFGGGHLVCVRVLRGRVRVRVRVRVGRDGEGFCVME